MTQLTHPTQTGLGNTKTSPLTLRSRSWCLTVNNYTEEEYNTITHALSEGEYIVGKETGEEGTPHLQCFVRYKNPRTFSSMKKKFPRAHIEIAKGNTNQNFNYCSKQENYKSNIEMKLSAKQEYEIYMNEEYKDIEWKNWQKDILNLLETKPSKRTINWYWREEGNVGKSYLSQFVDWKYDAIIANGKQQDVFNQYKSFIEENNKQPKVALIDIPRSHKEYVCYSTFEKIKDGLFYSGKYEGGKLRLIPHHLIVFANFYPDTSKLSEDRWNIVEIEE